MLKPTVNTKVGRTTKATVQRIVADLAYLSTIVDQTDEFERKMIFDAYEAYKRRVRSL